MEKVEDGGNEVFVESAETLLAVTLPTVPASAVVDCIQPSPMPEKTGDDELTTRK